MKKLTWYHNLGFFENPFSIKPSTFDNTILGYDKLIKDVNSKIKDGKVIFVVGPYGTGKTTILKGIIAEFGGKKDVIYYNCNRKDDLIDYDRLLINAGGWLRWIFRIRKKNMIILLDEAHEMEEEDMENLVEYYDQGFFISIVLVTTEPNMDLTDELEKMIKGNKVKTKKITKKDAIKIVRNRIGDLDFISDRMIRKVFDLDSNPRAFLKNCEDACRFAFEDEDSEKVTKEHVKMVKSKLKKV